MGIPDHLPASWEIYMQVKKQQLEPDMEQQTGSKLGKEYVKAVYCHAAYLTYIQTHSSVLAWRIPGTAEPSGLPSMGSHKVGHCWSDLAAAAEYIMWNARQNEAQAGIKVSGRNINILRFTNDTILMAESEE